jgi:hypothetical protein
MAEIKIEEGLVSLRLIEDYVDGFTEKGPAPRIIRLRRKPRAWCIDNLKYDPEVSCITSKPATSEKVGSLHRFFPAEEYYTISFASDRDAVLFKTFWL